MISASTRERMTVALDTLRRENARVQAAAPGMLESAWAWVMNAEPTVDGAENLARITDRTFRALEERYWTLLSLPESTDAEGERFIRDAQDMKGNADEIMESSMSLMTPGAALRETAAGTLNDLGSAFGTGSSILLIAVAIYLALVLSK